MAPTANTATKYTSASARNEKRSMMLPSAKVPTTPPTCSIEPISGRRRHRGAEIVEHGRQPVRQEIEVEQAHEEHHPQQQRRPAVRPSRNRCSTGMPVSCGSCTTNRVAGANAGVRIDHARAVRRRAPASRPVSARKRTDSGSRSARIGTSNSGATPPTTNTDASRIAGSMPPRAGRRARRRPRSRRT